MDFTKLGINNIKKLIHGTDIYKLSCINFTDSEKERKKNYKRERIYMVITSSSFPFRDLSVGRVVLSMDFFLQSHALLSISSLRLNIFQNGKSTNTKETAIFGSVFSANINYSYRKKKLQKKKLLH